MSNKAHTRRRTNIRTAGLSVTVIGLMALGAETASAHHADIAATAACDGTVTWTATAWNGETDASRTNASVQVSKTVGNGVKTTVTTGAFTKSSDFSFSGSFAVGTPLPTAVRVSAIPLGPWGNGAAAGEERSVDVVIPTNCPVVTPEPPVVTPEPPVVTPEPPVVTPVPPVVAVVPVVKTPVSVTPQVGGVAKPRRTAERAVEGAVLPATGGGAPLGLMVAMGLGLIATGAASIRAARHQS